EYLTVSSAAQRAELITELHKRASFSFDTETSHLDPRQARLLGMAFSVNPHTGYYVPLPEPKNEVQAILQEFRDVFESEAIEKVGHNLKFDLSVLKWYGTCVRGKLFDTMVAHSLLEADMRHSLDFLSETFLGYTPVPITSLVTNRENDPQLSIAEVPLEKIAEYAAENGDVALQLRGALEPLLKEKGQERVFYEVECPLIPVLVDMEYQGII